MTDNEKRWLKLLTTDPNQTDAVIALLKNGNPPIRLLGIIKAGYAAPNPALAAALQEIVLNDPYVTIAAQTPVIKKKLNNLPMNGKIDLLESIFLCPLRQAAGKVLKKWGDKTEVNAVNVNRCGIIHLAESYKNTDKLYSKQHITYEVSLFEPHSPAIAILFDDKAFDAKYHDVIEIFRKEYTKRHPADK